MAINEPVFIARRQQVLEQITVHPETHDQGSWEYPVDCGTSRCVAGWAIHFDAPAARDIWEAKSEAAHRLGLNGYIATYSQVGAKLLGLGEYEADELFHGADDEEAVDLLRQYAAGLYESEIVHLDGWDELPGDDY